MSGSLEHMYIYIYIFIEVYEIYFISGALMYLNEATLLNNVRTRYYSDKIYVSDLKYIF